MAKKILSHFFKTFNDNNIDLAEVLKLQRTIVREGVCQLHYSSKVVAAPAMIELNVQNKLDNLKIDVDCARFWEDCFEFGQKYYYVNSQWYRNTLDKKELAFNVVNLAKNIAEKYVVSDLKIDELSNFEIKNIKFQDDFLSYVSERNQTITVDTATRVINKDLKVAEIHSFLILAGISGTGKSRFVREQARCSAVKFGIDEGENFCLIPVRPDWHEPSDLLGYISRIDGIRYVATDFLKFIVKALIASIDSCNQNQITWKSVEKTAPYWLCLDEMNLAPVEQYFADYLAILETRKWLNGHYTCDSILKNTIFEELDEAPLIKLFEVLNISKKEFSFKSFDLFLQNELKEDPYKIYLNDFNAIIKHYKGLNNKSDFNLFELEVLEAQKIIAEYNSNYAKDKNNQFLAWSRSEGSKAGHGGFSAVAGKFVKYCDEVLSSSQVSIHNNLADYILKNGIPLPPNLIVAGTVNMDETTHGFSRKVLDRALSLDFNAFYKNDFDAFFEPTLAPKVLTYSTITQVQITDLSSTVDADGKKTIAFIKAINDKLKNTPFELAYRALNQALLLVAQWGQTTSTDEVENTRLLAAIWDDFLMMKVLPRIEGDDQKIGSGDDSILEQLAKILSGNSDFKVIWGADADDKTRPDLLQDGYDAVLGSKQIPCRSRAKLNWMIERMDRGYTSFWA